MNKIFTAAQYHLLTTILDQHRVAFVFWASAIFGFWFGIMQSTPQVAIEPAQVLSGIVSYPLENPYYIYQIKLWTILHQIIALFLYIGISETSIAIFLSGLIGATSFCALALWAFAFSDDWRIGLLTPFFVLAVEIGRWGIRYPLILMGSSDTYGITGLSTIALTLGLIGVKQFKWGLLLLGIAPAIHPSLGLWCNMLVMLCLALDFKNFFSHFRQAIKSLFLGYIITAISLIANLVTASHIPKIDPQIATEYLYNFISYWDVHRQPTDLFITNLIVVASVTLTVCIWSGFFQDELAGFSIFLARAVAISCILGLLASIVHGLPKEYVPNSLSILMPLRTLNLLAMIGIPVTLGVLWQQRNNFALQIILFVFIIGLVFPRLLLQYDFALYIFSNIVLIILVSLQKQTYLPLLFSCVFFSNYTLLRNLNEALPSLPNDSITQLLFLAIMSTIITLLAGYISFRNAGKPTQASMPVWMSTVLIKSKNYRAAITNIQIVLRWGILISLTLIAVFTTMSRVIKWSNTENPFRDYSNDPVFAEALHGKGLLATGSKIHLIQLYTRRPALLDVEGLDMLPYALEGGPEMNRILKDVYGVDLFNPPNLEIHEATLAVEPTKTIWEMRTIAHWVEIKKQYGVTDIITLANWQLNLPEIIRNANYVLYRIP